MLLHLPLPYFFVYKTGYFPSKKSQRSRSVLKDGSRSLRLFGREKITLLLTKTSLICIDTTILEALIFVKQPNEYSKGSV